ncbi:hypothetical protein HETIRDRAFT_456218 [Heterobasidion irregulare TC 32-1]|uniref:Uncharacterized protein n=1 Tax=Heterobasidion irregulare (strain TC 32-1) TaxID=747525 RepID=W4JM93_HETIT|nr:uncharacterized protein HETIRDRAFT_456218 [Heterobasidion irregulare TC 32-1]ETW74648.1 hypothetical protein HETIRDRAFT_456218 [Heterobasidion irregulare TC 32-1]
MTLATPSSRAKCKYATAGMKSHLASPPTPPPSNFSSGPLLAIAAHQMSSAIRASDAFHALNMDR